MTKALVAAAVVLQLSACGTTPPPEKPPVKIIGDTYCTAGRPSTWSRNDTTETIDETRKRNAGYDAKCGEKKSGG